MKSATMPGPTATAVAALLLSACATTTDPGPPGAATSSDTPSVTGSPGTEAPGTEGPGPGTTETGAPATASPGAAREVPSSVPFGEVTEPLVLQITNQSFDDPDVQLRVLLDGAELVDQSFAVKDQHTMTVLAVDATPGTHTLTVLSDTDVEVEQEVELSADGQSWVWVAYWFTDPAAGDSGGGEEPGPWVEVKVADEPFMMG